MLGPVVRSQHLGTWNYEEAGRGLGTLPAQARLTLRPGVCPISVPR